MVGYWLVAIIKNESFMRWLVSNAYPPQGTRVLLKGIWSHLSQRRKIQFFIVVLTMLANALAELVSLGAVLPFLAVLTDPEIIWNQPLVTSISKYFGLTEANQLAIPITSLFGTTVLIAAFIRLLNLRLSGIFIARVGSDLSCEVFKRTLYQPYEIHLKQNSATVITSVTVHITKTIVALTSLLQLIAAAVVTISLFTGILIVNWPIALSAVLIFGGLYTFLASTTRRELRTNSNIIANKSQHQLKILQEGLASIRDIILDSKQSAYLKIYQDADIPQRSLQARNLYLAIFPRYAVEALGLVAIAVFGLITILYKDSTELIVPLLGTLALGAQRLLPAMQQVYGNWSTIKAYNEDLARILGVISQPLPPEVLAAETIDLQNKIQLLDCRFAYSEGEPDVIRGVDLDIERGECIGIVGITGSGKSTLVDIIMGLLKPTSGQILVDGKDLYELGHPERINGWRASVAHVPQSIYLVDASVSQNIALETSANKQDISRIKFAAELACIDEVLESLPNGYDTVVGERGARLSGGQLQRIGIARALYKGAKILVLDEATSALDSQTEAKIISRIMKSCKDFTIIMIAHRTNTLYACNRIIKVENGLLKLNNSLRAR